MKFVEIAFSSPSLPAKREERAGERRFVCLSAPLSGSLPTRPSQGEREAKDATFAMKVLGVFRVTSTRLYSPASRLRILAQKSPVLLLQLGIDQ